MRSARFTRVATLLVFSLSLAAASEPATAASALEIDAEVDAALARFYEEVPVAKDLAQKAKGVLIFPKVVKAGSASAASMARARCALATDQWVTTTPQPPRSVCKSAFRRAPRS